MSFGMHVHDLTLIPTISGKYYLNIQGYVHTECIGSTEGTLNTSQQKIRLLNTSIDNRQDNKVDYLGNQGQKQEQEESWVDKKKPVLTTDTECYYPVVGSPYNAGNRTDSCRQSYVSNIVSRLPTIAMTRKRRFPRR